MRNKSTNTTLLVLTILLCLVVIGLGAYTYSFYNQVKESENQLLKDKQLVEAELQEEIVRYDKLLSENSQLTSQLSQAKDRLEAFQKRIDSNQVTRGVLQQYQLELRKLRKEREVLFRQNDSLTQETQKLTVANKRIQNSLDSITSTRKEPVVVTNELTPIVKPEPKVSVSNLKAYGVIQRNSGKFVSTSRAARAQMVRICYEVMAVQPLPDPALTFYVKVTNAKNNLIGVEHFVTLRSGEKVSYNATTSITYQNQPYNICELVLPLSTFAKGVYTVQILSDRGVLATTDLTLK